MGKTSIYLAEEDERTLRKLSREYGSRSEVLRQGLAALKRERIAVQLAEKYRRESPLPDSIAKIQSKAASDLGDYPW